MIRRILAFVFLVGCATLNWSQSVSVGAGSGAPVGTTNLTPTVSPGVQPTSGGSVTSLAITAPTSPVSGNAGWIFITAKGVTSETWTPASGWAQVGSTLSSVVTSDVVTAKFCKIFGGSEPASYTFSWNNTTTGGVQAVALQVAGSTGCTPSNSGSATGKASTLTVNSFTSTETQDLLLITVGQANNTTLLINNPLTTKQQNTSAANGIGVFTLPWPDTATPAVTSLNYAGGPFSDDTTLEVTALAPSTTSATTPYALNSTTAAIETGYLHVSGGGDYGAPVSGPEFIIPCMSSVSTTNPVNSFAAKRNDGTLVPLMAVSCTNGQEALDAAGQAVSMSMGSFGQTGGPPILFNAGFIDFISRDAANGSQDVNALSLSTAVAGDSINASSNNLVIGCLAEPCTGGTLEGDIIINAQSAGSRSVRIKNGNQDELWINGSGFVGAVPIAVASTPAAPTVTPTCAGGCSSIWGYRIGCIDSNGGVTLDSTEATTAAQNATLDSTHKNTITWNKVIGCKKYNVFRSTVATSPNTTGIIGTVASGLALSFVDSGAAGDSSTAPTVNGTGTIKAAGFISSGTAAVLSGTGACGTIDTQSGGATAGTARCTAATAASTLTITPGITAPHGWYCGVQDQTTLANLFQQTSNTTTTCVLTVTSVTQNDVFVFSAVAF